MRVDSVCAGKCPPAIVVRLVRKDAFRCPDLTCLIISWNPELSTAPVIIGYDDSIEQNKWTRTAVHSESLAIRHCCVNLRRRYHHQISAVHVRVCVRIPCLQGDSVRNTHEELMVCLL